MSCSDRDEVELVHILVGDVSVHNSTRQRILEAAYIASEDPRVDSLAGVDVHELGGFANAEASQCLLDLVDLSTANSLDLSLTNAVSVEDDLSRISSIGSLESFTSICHACAKRVGRFLTYIILHDAG